MASCDTAAALDPTNAIEGALRWHMHSTASKQASQLQNELSVLCVALFRLPGLQTCCSYQSDHIFISQQ